MLHAVPRWVSLETGTDLEDGSGLAVSTPSSGFHLNACSRDTAGCPVGWRLM